MGKLTSFDILFANASGVFYAGSIIQGHVNIELSEPMKMRGIKIKFEGKAHVHWTESESSGSGNDQKTETRHYSASENYCNQDVLLHGIWSGQGSTTTELAKGRHTFPFQFELPDGVPSSFESQYGYVRYSVNGTIDRPWKFDHKTRRAFTVISIFDLNSQPAYMNRMHSSNQKHLCCLCCKSGPITATFSIERQGYVPGEAIKLYADISNGASRKIDKSYVEMKMITTFHAINKSRTTKTEVARVTRPGIEGHSEDSWNGEGLIIPPLPPSFLVGCRIIDIRYILQLNVDPSGPSLDLEVPLEIIIGTIPLAAVVERFPPMNPSPSIGFAGGYTEPSAPSEEALFPPSPHTGIPNLPPPSYAECVTGRVDIREEGDSKHTRGNMNFAPIYTYYNWGHEPGALPPQSGK